jgi:hypothetical protein
MNALELVRLTQSGTGLALSHEIGQNTRRFESFPLDFLHLTHLTFV